MSSEEKQEDDAGGNETNVEEDNGNSISQQSQNVRQTQARAPKRPNSDGQTNGTAAKNTCTETNGASGSERHDEESSDEEEPTQPEPVLFSDISDSDSSAEPTENETEWGILLRVDNRIVLQGRPPATVPANPSMHYDRTFVRNATSLRVIVQHIMLDEVNGTMTPGPIVPPQPTVPPPIPPLPSMSATQRNMWMRQQVDAENRRRRATANVVANTSLPPTNFASTSTTDSEPVTRAAAARGEDWIGAYINVSSFRRMLANVLRYDDSGMVSSGSISLPSHNCLAVTLIHRCTVVFPYSVASGGDQRSCVICISEYQEGQDVRRLPCMHVFHRECVDRWMLDQLRCPICRYDILERAAELNSRDENNEPSTSDAGTNTQNVE